VIGPYKNKIFDIYMNTIYLRPQCQALTQKGEQCTRIALAIGSGLCSHHDYVKYRRDDFLAQFDPQRQKMEEDIRLFFEELIAKDEDRDYKISPEAQMLHNQGLALMEKLQREALSSQPRQRQQKE